MSVILAPWGGPPCPPSFTIQVKNKHAQTEITRVARLDEPQVIIPVPVQDLIAETFDTELLALAGRQPGFLTRAGSAGTRIAGYR